MDGSRDRGSGMARAAGTVLAAMLLIILVAVPPVSATVFMYTGTGNGSIQDMINRTGNGDSVFVVPGTYRENLVIDRPIVFGGLDSTDPPVIVTSASQPGITLAADGITLGGISLTGDAPTGIAVQSNNNRISDVTVRGFKRGIELKTAENNIFIHNTIANNSIGILTDPSSRGNTFYLNRFDNQIADVSGQSQNTRWYSTGQDYAYNGNSYSGSLGNSWRAYNGTDSDGNGIGDSPYTVSAGDQTSPGGVSLLSSDRAPLTALPDAYTLLVKNSTALNATGQNSFQNHPDFTTGRQQLQQPPEGVSVPAAETPGAQAPLSEGAPGSQPGSVTTPPGGIAMLPFILMDFWWIIVILIVISVVAGVWFGRRWKRSHATTRIEYVHVDPSSNATVVKKPGGGSPSQVTAWKGESYAVHLPPALAKKYPDAEYMGEGGVGRVFKAWNAAENREVAVKIPIRFDEITGTQFTKELHIWQGLHHRNIVEIYAANVFPMPYIEMEYVGSSLAALKFPLETGRAVRIITGVAEGLRYAHGMGIVHRDIKPENILITEDDVPKITDWGLAKALSDNRQTGLISFSLNYAAPEQLAPNIYGDAGQWTDIYQLGVLFYEMVAGRLPFSGAGMGEITQAILHETPRPPNPAGGDAEAIRDIILKCLQKRPGDRYASVADILDDLHRLGGQD